MTAFIAPDTTSTYRQYRGQSIASLYLRLHATFGAGRRSRQPMKTILLTRSHRADRCCAWIASLLIACDFFPRHRQSRPVRQNGTTDVWCFRRCCSVRSHDASSFLGGEGSGSHASSFDRR